MRDSNGNGHRTLKRAFTLIEILIVVVILGILAAIITPQFATATSDTKAANIKSQIAMMQRQIELFHARNGHYPFPSSAGPADWDTLTGDEDLSGTIDAGEHVYFKDVPSNPAWQPASAPEAAMIDVVGAGTRGSAGAGWVWELDNYNVHASFFDETTGVVTEDAID